MLKPFIYNCVAFAYNLSASYIYFKSFLYYLWYLIQYTCYINSLSTMWEVKVSVTQSCPTLCDSMDCSLPGFSVHGILQARIPEWVAITFSRESSQPRDWTWVSHLEGRFVTIWATREVQVQCKHFVNSCQFAVHSSFAFLELSEILFFKYFPSVVGWIYGCGTRRYRGPLIYEKNVKIDQFN